MNRIDVRRPVDPDVDLTPAAVAGGSLAGRPATVLGLARTGVALARFLVDAGASVTVYDRRPAEELAGAIASLVPVTQVRGLGLSDGL